MSVAFGIDVCEQADNPEECLRDFLACKTQTLQSHPKPFVAVGSKGGILVDQHLGEVWAFQIWEPIEHGYMHLDDRIVPVCETGLKRWFALANALQDCRAVLVSGVGEFPEQVLAQNGISVIEMNGFVTMGLDALYQAKGGPLLSGRRRNCSRGGRCSGIGGGCRKKE